MTTPDIETIIIGGGVVGLAIARSLSQRGCEVLVIERHPRTGAETSSRNSEVIHAGIYYPPGSLRARLCVDGKKQLYRFASENNITVAQRGKLVVATSPTEEQALTALAERADANGADCRLITGTQARRMEPYLECVAALHSPTTGVIDSHGLLIALEGHITSHAGQIVLSTEVTEIEKLSDFFRVHTKTTGTETDTAQLTCRTLIIAAGLSATTVANMLHAQFTAGYSPPDTYPCKGHYYALTGSAPFEHLIYPAPSGAWLGIHLTIDIAGQAKFGPDADWIKTVDYSFDDEDGDRLGRFVSEIQRYWPGLTADRLSPGYTGIRPKIYRSGEPAPDFAIHGPDTHGIDGLISLYGIESPGLTAALAIADEVARRLPA